MQYGDRHGLLPRDAPKSFRLWWHATHTGIWADPVPLYGQPPHIGEEYEHLCQTVLPVRASKPS